MIIIGASVASSEIIGFPVLSPLCHIPDLLEDFVDGPNFPNRLAFLRTTGRIWEQKFLSKIPHGSKEFEFCSFSD